MVNILERRRKTHGSFGSVVAVQVFAMDTPNTDLTDYDFAVVGLAVTGGGDVILGARKGLHTVFAHITMQRAQDIVVVIECERCASFAPTGVVVACRRKNNICLWHWKNQISVRWW